MRTLRKFDVGGAREAGGGLVQTTPAQRRRNSGQRGSTLVEYALTLVISFVLLFAIIDFGRALYSYHFVNYAAREAARFASMRGANSCGGTVSPCSVTPGDISNFVQQITPAGIDAGLVTLNAPTWTNPNNLPVCNPIPNYPGCAVQVQVQYTFNFIFPYNFYNSAPVSFQATSINMVSTSQMIISR